jgi:hypothetical protein
MLVFMAAPCGLELPCSLHQLCVRISHTSLRLKIIANQVRLCEFKFRDNERFLYEYDLSDCWRHEVRIEAREPLIKKHLYPCCIGGQRRAPPEDCGGPLAFMTRRDESPSLVEDLLEDIRDDREANDLEAIRDRVEYIEELREWLTLDSFDRRAVNRRLKQYATNDETWRWQ